MFLIIVVTRADSKYCWRMPDVREALNRSVREGRIESNHSIKSFEGMGSRTHNLGTESRMHSLTVDCDTFSNEEKVAVAVLVTSVELEVTGSVIMLAVCSSN